MRRKNYTAPAIHTVTVAMEHDLLAASATAVSASEEQMPWGGNASDNNITEADAKGHDISFWDE